MITGNEPINPTIWDDANKPAFIRDNDGLTIRQYYTGLAIQGLCVNFPTVSIKKDTPTQKGSTVCTEVQRTICFRVSF